MLLQQLQKQHIFSHQQLINFKVPEEYLLLSEDEKSIESSESESEEKPTGEKKLKSHIRLLKVCWDHQPL